MNVLLAVHAQESFSVSLLAPGSISLHESHLDRHFTHLASLLSRLQAQANTHIPRHKPDSTSEQDSTMTAVPKTLSEAGRRESSGSQKRGASSYGRGGAGNMGPSSAGAEPVNLETPTLKSDMYTTGRGGSGNMAKNDMGEEARRAQDVVGYVVVLSPSRARR